MKALTGLHLNDASDCWNGNCTHSRLFKCCFPKLAGDCPAACFPLLNSLVFSVFFPNKVCDRSVRG